MIAITLLQSEYRVSRKGGAFVERYVYKRVVLVSTSWECTVTLF